MANLNSCNEGPITQSQSISYLALNRKVCQPLTQANGEDELKVIGSPTSEVRDPLHRALQIIHNSHSYRSMLWERKIFDDVNLKGNVLCTVFSNPFLFYFCKCNYQNLFHIGMTSIKMTLRLFFNNSGTFPTQQNLSSFLFGPFVFVELVLLLFFNFFPLITLCFHHHCFPWPTSLCLPWQNQL